MKLRKLDPREQTHLARFGTGAFGVTTDTSEPVEYITGVAEFCDLALYVSSDVLIPRLETEELVALAKTHAQTQLQTKKHLTIADVGTGSGAVAIALLVKLRNYEKRVTVRASDISTDALRVAKENAREILGKNPCLSFSKSDLLKHLPKKMKFDIVVANLPYIPHQRITRLSSSVKNHEPHLALDGGEDGLQAISKLLEQAPDFLKKSGVVLLEIDHTHNLRKFAAFDSAWNMQILKDSFGKNRFLEATLKS